MKLSEKQLKKYQNLAKKIRKEIIEISYKTKSTHIGPSFSIIELLISLYFKHLKINPKNPLDKNRDKFILSKGHACPALYTTLFYRGFFNRKFFDGFAKDGGTLEHHINLNQKIGIEASTGSLGHGLSLGIGMALAAKNNKSKEKIFVILSDGELDEGSNWEAIMFAAQQKLDNLIAIVDYNKIQALGRVKEVIDLKPLAKKWQSFNWAVKEIKGHDFNQIFNALEKIPFRKNKPSVIIAHTIKGKGVSFMENKLLWHYRCPDDDEYKKTLKELS